MSISNARSFIEKSGCGWVTGGALIVVMIAGVFTANTCGRNGGQEEQIRPVVPIAKIGSQVVDYNALRDLADRNIQQYSAGEAGLDPAVEGRLYADVTQTLVSRALIQEIGSERRITVDDAELKKDFEMKMEGQIMQTKFDMIQRKLIKPDATEAEFAAAFKNTLGKDLDQAKNEALTQYEESLKDPNKRSEIAFELLARKVQDSYKSKVTLTDADLKKGFDTYTTKRIIANANGANAKEARAKVAKALAEVKSGMSFEAAINKYTDDPEPAKGKPKSESTLDLQYSVLTYDATLEPILKLKVGDISPILPTSSGPAIYKLIKIQNKLPAEFEKQKATLKEGRIKDMATKIASDDIRKRVSEIKFDSPVAKLLVDWRMAMSEPALNIDRSKLKAKLKEIYEGLKDANDVKFDPRAVTLATYAAFSDYYDELTPEEQKPLQTDRLELLKTALESAPHIESFHELAKMAMSAKDGATAFDALKSAMDINAGASDLAVTRHKSQQLLRNQFASSGLSKPDQVKELDAALDRWKKDLFEDLKLAAESNADYTDLGEQEFKSQHDKVDRFLKAGYITASQSTELKTSMDKWKVGAFSDLKLQIEGNNDYTDFGQSTFSDLNARIDKFALAGYITPPQKSELQALQAKWRDAKKKFDEDEAKKAPKVDPKSSVPPNTDPKKPTTGGSSSNDLLKGSTTGN